MRARGIPFTRTRESARRSAGPAPGDPGLPGAPGAPGTPGAPGSGSWDEPGHTRAFTVQEAQLPQEHITTYRAGERNPRIGAARLPWRELLTGIYRNPTRTFAQMRSHQVWGPALVVSSVYGLLATFGIGGIRGDIFDSSIGLALLALLYSALAFVLAGVVFGTVTHGLARRLGGDGAWAPTVGLSMLISWGLDLPRALLTLFLPASNVVVQALGWATWVVCLWLLSAMVRQVHDLPWGKALGAASVQLIALLLLITLPAVG
ncbi:YIP1 family protein [Streptacidiphilus sp. 4-A2]|nr:YIP1 family protein [Streptacidiphilus sp. 4-A2]